MAHRPLPIFARGPRRTRPRTGKRFLACPKVSPQWELAALRALIKPQTKGAIAHRQGFQHWPAGAAEVVEAAGREIEERLGVRFSAALPRAGDYHLFVEVDEAALPAARALAVLVSRRLPELWFVFDRLLVHEGRFYRRRRGYMLELREATDVHLARDVRAALRGVI